MISCIPDKKKAETSCSFLKGTSIYIFLECSILCIIPVDTRRRIDVEMTSCVYWDGENHQIKKFALFEVQHCLLLMYIKSIKIPLIKKGQQKYEPFLSTLAQLLPLLA